MSQTKPAEYSIFNITPVYYDDKVEHWREATRRLYEAGGHYDLYRIIDNEFKFVCSVPYDKALEIQITVSEGLRHVLPEKEKQCPIQLIQE